jgi:hypothetical protein
MSTLLSELDSAPGQGDGDFVQNILNEMNGGSAPMNPPAPIQPPPAAGGSNLGVINAPNPNTIAPHQMDSAPITAHMIGNSQPTPGDFAHMMNSNGPAAAPQGGEQWGSAAGPPQRQVAPAPPKRSWFTKALDEFRVPFIVAIIVFVFSLPVINFVFAHYLPSMVKSTGELTLVGLGIKSLAAGASFWVLQRVVVPLLSL